MKAWSFGTLSVSLLLVACAQEVEVEADVGTTSDAMVACALEEAHATNSVALMAERPRGAMTPPGAPTNPPPPAPPTPPFDKTPIPLPNGPMHLLQGNTDFLIPWIEAPNRHLIPDPPEWTPGPDKVNRDYPGNMQRRLERGDYKSTDELLKALGAEIRAWLGPYKENGFQCRHNSTTARDILNAMIASGAFPALRDVESVKLTGSNINGGGHAWVEVKMKDGSVYYFDPMNGVLIKKVPLKESRPGR